MQVQNVPIVSGVTPPVIVNGSGRLLWHSFKETTGAAQAEYTFTDGNKPDAKVILPVTLAAGESTRDYMGRHGIPFEQGLYFDLVGGAVSGNVVFELCDPTTETPIPIVFTMPLDQVMAQMAAGS